MALGNYSVSSLLSQTTAAANKLQSYNDQIAAYEYDLSPKDEASFAKYQSYLNTAAAKAKNDPSKQLSYQKSVTGAYRAFNSAEIGRLSTAVKYGDTDNRSKYNQMKGLYEAAQANGDANLAQSLESQLASLSVTIQNEDIAAQNKADAASKAELSTSRKKYQAVDKASSQLMAQLEQAAKTGQKVTIDGQQYAVTPKFLAEQKGQLLSAQADRLQQQIDGGLDDEMGTMQTKLETLKASNDFVKYASPTGYGATESGLNRQSLKYDPTTKSFGVTDTPYTVDQSGNPQYKGGANGSNYIVQRQYDKTTKGADSQTSYILPGFKVNDKAAPDFGAKGYFDPIAQKTIYDIGDLPGQSNGKSIINFAHLAPGENYKQLTELAKNAGRTPGLMDTYKQFYGSDLPGAINASKLLNHLPSAGLVGSAFGPVGAVIGNLLGGVDAMRKQREEQARVEAARKAVEAAAVARLNAPAAYAPALAPKMAPAPPPPKPATPVQNIINSVPRAATPQQTVFNQVSKLIDTGIAAQAKSPAPKQKPWWQFW